MGRGCVEDCQHRLWGGNGVCTEAQHGRVVCSCDSGYASRDALGNASCVPTRVLVTGYLILAIVSVLAGSVVLWSAANQHRQVARASRKARIRMRALLFTSVHVLGFGVMGTALAIQAGDSGFYEATGYILLVPQMMFGAAQMAEFWVNSLPSQLIPPESLAGKLQSAAEKHDLFVLNGIINAGVISAFGITAWFNWIWAPLCADLAIVAGSLIAVTVIIFVAARMTGIINEAILKGSVNSKLLYTKAKRRLWLQAMALCGAGLAVVVIIAIKWTTTAGQNTPIIVYSMEMMAGHVASVLFATTTRVQPPGPPNMRRETDDETQDQPTQTYPGHGQQRRPTMLAIQFLNQLPIWKYQSGQHLLENATMQEHRRGQEEEDVQTSAEAGVSAKKTASRQSGPTVKLKKARVVPNSEEGQMQAF